MAKRRTGRALGSASVVADSTQTLLCTYLSAIVLVGLVLNATLGWSWADPVAALVVAGIACGKASGVARGRLRLLSAAVSEPGFARTHATSEDR